MSTPAYLRPQSTANPARVRETNQYTLTIDSPTLGDTGRALHAMNLVLEEEVVMRTGTIADQGRAGVSYRAPGDETAAAIAQLLLEGVEGVLGSISTGVRLWTGYGIHTREIRLG